MDLDFNRRTSVGPSNILEKPIFKISESKNSGLDFKNQFSGKKKTTRKKATTTTTSTTTTPTKTNTKYSKYSKTTKPRSGGAAPKNVAWRYIGGKKVLIADGKKLTGKAAFAAYKKNQNSKEGVKDSWKKTKGRRLSDGSEANESEDEEEEDGLSIKKKLNASPKKEKPKADKKRKRESTSSTTSDQDVVLDDMFKSKKPRITSQSPTIGNSSTDSIEIDDDDVVCVKESPKISKTNNNNTLFGRLLSKKSSNIPKKTTSQNITRTQIDLESDEDDNKMKIEVSPISPKPQQKTPRRIKNDEYDNSFIDDNDLSRSSSKNEIEPIIQEEQDFLGEMGTADWETDNTGSFFLK